MGNAIVARNYAEALLSLAQKADDLRGWGAMISDVADAMERDARLRHFLESPRISADVKNEVLGRAFQDRMPRVFVRFLQTVVNNRRQMLIPHIAAQFHTLVDEIEGRVHARVTVAAETDEAGRELIARELSRVVGKTVVPHLSVNPSILGGLVVRIGDTVMDGSVRRRLAVLRRRMLTGRAG